MSQPRANTKEAQLGRLIDTARAHGLTVHAIEVGPKLLRLVTAPLPESSAPADAADRWLRDQGAGKADRRA